MPYRLTKIYTRKGDKGYTYFGKKQISKDDALIEVLGSLDELNSMIGVLLSCDIRVKAIEDSLTRIQNDLFHIGAELYDPTYSVINGKIITELEEALDQWNQTLMPLEEFLLPGGNMATATCHLARATCRRAERTLVHLHRQNPLNNILLLSYLNRLSDFLFVIARIIATKTGAKELMWQPSFAKKKEDK